MNLQEGLNSGSGVNYRGQVGDLMETLACTTQNYVTTQSGGRLRPSDNDPTKFWNFQGFEFMVQNEWNGIGVEESWTIPPGDPVPVGSTGKWTVEIDTNYQRTMRRGADLLGNDVATDIQAYNEIFAELLPLVDRVCLGVFTMAGLTIPYEPGVTELEDEGVQLSIYDVSGWRCPAPSVINI